MVPFVFFLAAADHRILRPGFFMENYEGTIGSITVAVLKEGLKPSTTLQLIVSMFHCFIVIYWTTQP
jgi:hypothetical protein